jgi:hypothetical protein
LIGPWSIREGTVWLCYPGVSWAGPRAECRDTWQPASGAEYACGMNLIQLTDEELRIVRAALHAYLDDFGHEEADLLREVKALIAKLSRE